MLYFLVDKTLYHMFMYTNHITIGYLLNIHIKVVSSFGQHIFPLFILLHGLMFHILPYIHTSEKKNLFFSEKTEMKKLTWSMQIPHICASSSLRIEDMSGYCECLVCRINSSIWEETETILLNIFVLSSLSLYPIIIIATSVMAVIYLY